MKYSIGNDRVSLCEKGTCLHLKGDTAKVISTMVALFVLVAVGSNIVRAIR
ncbi:MAG: hypothetical protein AAFQ20_09150 [Bacteroidota bacterium]